MLFVVDSNFIVVVVESVSNCDIFIHFFSCFLNYVVAVAAVAAVAAVVVAADVVIVVFILLLLSLLL